MESTISRLKTTNTGRRLSDNTKYLIEHPISNKSRMIDIEYLEEGYQSNSVL